MAEKDRHDHGHGAGDQYAEEADDEVALHKQLPTDPKDFMQVLADFELDKSHILEIRRIVEQKELEIMSGELLELQIVDCIYNSSCYHRSQIDGPLLL